MVRRDAYLQLKKREDKIGTYVDALNYLLESYGANANIAKATLRIAQFMKLINDSAVQFANAVHLR